jgi:hypothetical protein
MSTAKLGLRPYTVTRKEAKTLLPPSYVERLIYAANNFPELGWLEISCQELRVANAERLTSS